MSRKYFQYIVVILISTIAASALWGKAGDNGLAFLKVDVDARAAAMGGAYTALADNAGAAYWNPAGLGLASEKSLLVMHNQWLADITQQFAAVQLRTGKNALAVSFNIMTIPGIEIRDDIPTDQPLGTSEAINLVTGLSYARTLANGWYGGISLKYLFEKYYLESASGWAIDLGVRKDFSSSLFWGATVQNLGSMNRLVEKATPLPVILRTGIGYRLPYLLLGNKPLLAADLQYNVNEQILFRLGGQLDLGKYLSICLGGLLGEIDSGLTAGLGLAYHGYGVNYAYVPQLNDLGDSHRLSFNMLF